MKFQLINIEYRSGDELLISILHYWMLNILIFVIQKNLAIEL